MVGICYEIYFCLAQERTHLSGRHVTNAILGLMKFDRPYFPHFKCVDFPRSLSLCPWLDYANPHECFTRHYASSCLQNFALLKIKAPRFDDDSDKRSY